MQPLFDITKLDDYKYNIKLPFKCEFCLEIFHIQAKWVKFKLKNDLNKFRFCSSKCAGANQTKNGILDLSCEICNKSFKRHISQQKQSKSGKQFCSTHCAAIYNNAHKTTGTRRSKLEIWLESKLIDNFSNLNILYNDKTAINSELDIYIPSLNLAFELNGIFHYEPIYGSEKLASIQNNDNRKFQACLEKKIELVIIDSSSFKNFKEKNADKYWQIIKTIIENKLVRPA